MSLSDPIADMITRVRNAARNHDERVDCRNSKVCAGIARVLREEGYIRDFSVIDNGHQGILRLELKYGDRGEPLINALNRLSKPGRRVYTKVRDIPRPLAGLGISILTTPRGVLSDRQCREHKVGGELLCSVE